MRVIGYARVSTDRQASEGVSLDAQRGKIEAYCALHDLELVRVEVDAGESAKSLDRPALQRVLASLRRNEADGLVCLKIDRLSRSLPDLLGLVERVFSGKRGKSLRTVDGEVDTTTAQGRMILSILGSVAAHDRQATGERVAMAKAHLRAAGKHSGGKMPLGLALADDGETYVEVTVEQVVIAEMRQLRDRGMSIREIASLLAERGVELRGSISVGKVQRVLAAAPRPSAIAA